MELNKNEIESYVKDIIKNSSYIDAVASLASIYSCCKSDVPDDTKLQWITVILEDFKKYHPNIRQI